MASQTVRDRDPASIGILVAGLVVWSSRSSGSDGFEREGEQRSLGLPIGGDGTIERGCREVDATPGRFSRSDSATLAEERSSGTL